VTAPLARGATAVLSLDADLQRAAEAVMKRYTLPEAGVVLSEVKTGNVLVYASYLHSGPQFDFNARAEAPAASIFKVVTGAALVEMAGLNAETEQCYHGGKSHISRDELQDNAELDKWCASLGAAMGRSLNVVFGRLASKHLSVEQLTSMGGAFGFGAPVPFEAVNEASLIQLPEGDPLEFARSAAGFWHSSLSPLAGAVLAQTVANGGVTLQPSIVREAISSEGETFYERNAEPRLLRRAIKPETARELTRMLVQTTLAGSAHKAFFDPRGRAHLPNITVAGKTGTLTRHKENRHYTWFVGFAPAEAPEVAISALVVNTPVWRIKGPDLARDVLRAYFAKQGRSGVTSP
jgi:cell division protein FtsI/penicillin-binding protein 2